MYLIFNSKGVFSHTLSVKPDMNDLKTRGEMAFEGVLIPGKEPFYSPKENKVIYRDYAPTPFHIWDTDKWILTEENRAKMIEYNERVLKQKAEAEVKRLMVEANAKIIPLQDAVDLDMATDEEITQLRNLKRFRVMLSRWVYPDPIPILVS